MNARAMRRWPNMALDPFMPILVVDDQDTAIRVRALLRTLGFRDVDDTGTFAEALNMMRGKRYGLVISDWCREPMSGNDLLREARGDAGLNRIPFIMTGESKSAHVVAAKRAGASGYIVKPFNAQTLKAKMKAALATKTPPPPERQPAATKASGETDTSAATKKKFDGLFTSSL
jgi:two-component system, chemotaxis family, chemotaxis protein CheY